MAIRSIVPHYWYAHYQLNTETRYSLKLHALKQLGGFKHQKVQEGWGV